MKICPYCSEQIQDSAVKCRYCGEWLTDENRAAVEQSRHDNTASNVSNAPAPIQAISDSEEVRPHSRPSKRALLAVAGIAVITATGGLLLAWGLHVLPSTARQDVRARVESMSHEVGASADRVDSSLNSLRTLGLVSNKSEAERGIAAIEKAQTLQTDARNKNAELVSFVEGHRSELQDQGFGQLVDLTAVYGETYHAYQDALSEFLASYRDMLVYFRDHSDAIQQNVDPYRGHYERLYAKYTTALKKQNKAYLEHVAFLKQYANEHPSMANTLNEVIPKSAQ